MNKKLIVVALIIVAILTGTIVMLNHVQEQQRHNAPATPTPTATPTATNTPSPTAEPTPTPTNTPTPMPTNAPLGEDWSDAAPTYNTQDLRAMDIGGQKLYGIDIYYWLRGEASYNYCLLITTPTICDGSGVDENYYLTHMYAERGIDQEPDDGELGVYNLRRTVDKNGNLHTIWYFCYGSHLVDADFHWTRNEDLHTSLPAYNIWFDESKQCYYTYGHVNAYCVRKEEDTTDMVKYNYLSGDHMHWDYFVENTTVNAYVHPAYNAFGAYDVFYIYKIYNYETNDFLGYVAVPDPETYDIKYDTSPVLLSR